MREGDAPLRLQTPPSIIPHLKEGKRKKVKGKSEAAHRFLNKSGLRLTFAFLLLPFA
jgi:hypothetical protein